MQNRKEFGDFQTPLHLALQAAEAAKKIIPDPSIIVEPTSGSGNFIEATHHLWGNSAQYYGFELNDNYISLAQERFKDIEPVHIKKEDFFTNDWERFFGKFVNDKILVIGNPPWVTNAGLGALGSNNLPAKSNFQGLNGFDAKTGKANFDIAEWIIIRLIQAIKNKKAVLAMLCKTSTARKVLQYFWREYLDLGESNLYLINAKDAFDVAVDACLLLIDMQVAKHDQCANVYGSLTAKNPNFRFGLYNGELVADLDSYIAYKDIDGLSNYTWRSGVKHDASRLMELTPMELGYENGFNELVDTEDTYLYPLLKSSDIANGRVTPRKYVIVTQDSVGGDTSTIREAAPLTWRYLSNHSDILDNRKSSIYKNKPKYSIFGIGPYSFSMWKVAISGMYKNIRFVTVPPYSGKPVMLDDTCYFFPCSDENEARFWCDLLNSEDCQNFMRALVFFDAKRPVTVDVLKRIDFIALAKRKGNLDQAENYLKKTQMIRTC